MKEETMTLNEAEEMDAEDLQDLMQDEGKERRDERIRSYGERLSGRKDRHKEKKSS